MSEYESSSNSVLEAMAHDLKVISTDVGDHSLFESMGANVKVIKNDLKNIVIDSVDTIIDNQNLNNYPENFSYNSNSEFVKKNLNSSIELPKLIKFLHA